MWFLNLADKGGIAGAQGYFFPNMKVLFAEKHAIIPFAIHPLSKLWRTLHRGRVSVTSITV
jgi:hypothetical protein